MDDLISRQAAIEEIRNLKISVAGKDIFPNESKETIIKTLDELQSVQQEHRTGKWLLFDDESNSYCCSACNTAYMLIEGTPKDNEYKYCPNCGAKMEEGE